MILWKVTVPFQAELVVRIQKDTFPTAEEVNAEAQKQGLSCESTIKRLDLTKMVMEKEVENDFYRQF